MTEEEKRKWAETLRADKEFMDGCRRGLAAAKAGKVKPWSQVKKELGIED